MNKKSMAKIGAVGLIIVVFTLLFILIFPLFGSALVDKEYFLGEQIKINLRSYGYYKMKITTPSTSYIYPGNSNIVLFTPKQTGKYRIELNYGKKSEYFDFLVVEQNEGEAIEEVLFNQDLPEKPIVVGEEVKWKREMELAGRTKINLPLAAENVTVYNLVGNQKQKKEIVVQDKLNEKEIVLDVNGKIELVYETESPKKIETDLNERKKEVKVYTDSGTHYKNVSVSTRIEKKIPFEKKQLIRVYWKEENKYLGFEAKDDDLDGFIDRIEWIIPHLSEQNFEIIIVTRAEHLDSQRQFLRDVYLEVSELDEIWSGDIGDGEYVRVTFEENLTSQNDITIFPRTVSGNPVVKVYEFNGTLELAEFSSIADYQYNKIFLTNLSGTQDTFDLRVINGTVEFDHIIDPYLDNASTTATATLYGYEDSIVRLDSGELIAVWINNLADIWCSNSSDGEFWSSVNITYADLNFTTPSLATNGSRIVIVAEETNGNDIMRAYSDSGCAGDFSFADIPNMGDVGGAGNMDVPAIAVGPDGRFHVCAIENDNEVRYANSSDGATWNSALEFDSTRNDECDIAVDSNNMVWIVRSDATVAGNDIEIANSSDGFVIYDNYLIANGNMGTGDAFRYPSVAIGNNNEVYVAWANYNLTTTQGDSDNRFMFANSTNGYEWSYQNVTTDLTLVGDTSYPVVKVNANTGEIYVIYEQDLVSGEYAVFVSNSTDEGLSWSHELIQYNDYLWNQNGYSARYPNLRGGKYPESNEITGRLDYLYTTRQVGGLYRVVADYYDLEETEINKEGIFVMASSYPSYDNRSVVRYLDENGTISRKYAPRGTNVEADRSWQKIRCLEKRKECILLWNDAANDIHFEVFHTDTGLWSDYLELTFSPNNDDSLNFDIECEDLSGECLIVYDHLGGNDQLVAYRIYDGGLGEEQTIDAISANSLQDWIKLYPKEGSDDIMMVVQDTARDINAILWNGTSNSFISSTNQLITNNVPNVADRKMFDFAWEGESGNGLIANAILGNGSLNAYYFNYTNLAWSNIGAINVSAQSGYPYNIVLCGSEPLSNGNSHDYVGIMLQSWDGVQAYLYGYMWNGSSVEASPPTEDLTTETLTATENIECEWEKSGEQAVFLWAGLDELIPSWASYTIGSGWDIESFASGKQEGAINFAEDVDDLKIIPNHESDEMMAVGQNILTDIYCFVWDGNSFNNQSCANKVLLESSSPNIAFTSETFDYTRFDSIPPGVTVISPLNGSLIETSSVAINFTLNEPGTCNYSLDSGQTNITMTANFNSTRFNATSSALLELTYTVYAYCEDFAGNKNNSVFSEFIVDYVYPFVNFTPPTENNDTNFSRNWIYLNVTVNETNEANTTFTLHNSAGFVDEITFIDATHSWNFTNLLDESYYYNVTVCDIGNKCNNTETRQITIDDTVPAISIEHPEARTYTFNESLPLNYTVSDNLIGLDSCWWNLDNGENKSIACDQNDTFNASSDGSYTLYFFSNDSLNNIGSSSRTFFVSVDAPAITLEINEGYFYNRTNLIEFNYTPRDKQGIDTCELWGNWTGTWHKNQTDNGINNYTLNSFNLSLLPEGVYGWNIWCNDTTGAEAFSALNYSFGIDTTFPLIGYGGGTELNYANKSRNWIYVNITVNETNENYINFTLFNSNEELVNETQYNDSTRVINWTNLENGYYYYNVSIYDRAGNYNSTETRLILLDTGEPFANLTLPSNGTYSKNTTQNLSVNLSDEFGIKNTTLFVFNSTNNLVNETTRDLSGTQITLGIIYEFLYDGIFRWFYNAFDLAGNSVLTENNTITIDTVNPAINFTYPTEATGTYFERQWIYANVTFNDTNFANVTFTLHNTTGSVNITNYDTEIYEINWTDLDNSNVTYYYNVTVIDKAGNENTTETRNIKLTDITPPTSTLVTPYNRTYYSKKIFLNITAYDTNLDSCWYTINNGENNVSISNCLDGYITIDDGDYEFSIYVNDTVGQTSENSVNMSVATASLVPGIFAYGEGTNPVVKYRLWNGYEFIEELSANSLGVGAVVEWVRARMSPVRDEKIIVTADDDDDINIQINSTLPDGSSCWHNGSACGTVFEVTTGSTSLNYRKADVAYETDSGDALIVWSDNDASPQYVVWNGSSFSSIGTISQTRLAGIVSFTKLESHPFSDEIALIMANTTNTNIMIWDGSSWGCEPPSLLTYMHDPGQVYQIADSVYEQVSGDLFVAGTSDGPTQFNYTTKLNGVCSYTTSAVNFGREIEGINLGVRQGSDYILVSGYDRDNTMDNIVWDGDSFLASSNTEGSLTTRASPSIITDGVFAGTGDTALVIYADGDLSTSIDYFKYNITSDTWDDNGGTGYNVQGLTPFSYYERNIKAYSFREINSTLIIIQDAYNDMWVKAYDADYDEWREPDYGNYIEDQTSSTNFPSFGFAFADDKAGPLITINSPSATFIYNSTVRFNVSTSETGSCYYSIDENDLVLMQSFSNLSFYGINDSVLNGIHNLTYFCYDGYNNLRNSTTNFTVDAVYPLIDYGEGTEDNYANKSRNWIYINVSVNETNFANITFTLHNSTGVKNITTYFTQDYDINFTNLIDGTYYYNVTIVDIVSNFNTTATRTIRLDTAGPNVTLNTPRNNTYTNQTNQNLTVNLSDTTGLKNATLYVYNSTDNLINETGGDLTGIQTTFGIIYEFLYDGIFRWFYKAFDVLGNNAFSTQNNTITIDTAYPLINYSEGTEVHWANKSQNWIFVNVSVNETNLANLTFYLFNSIGGMMQANDFSDSTRWINWTGLAENVYYYNVNITDKAGLRNYTSMRAIKLDRTPPSVNIISPLVRNYSSSSILFNVSINFGEESNCNYSLDGGVTNSTMDTTDNLFHNKMNDSIADGFYTVRFYCWDYAGNLNSTTTRYFGIDTLYPLIDYGYGTEDSYTNFSRNWIYVNVTVNETNFANITFTLHNSTGVKNITTYFTQDYDINFTNLIDGDYYYNVTITDSANNKNVTLTRTIRLDTQGPGVILNIPKNNTFTKNTTQNLTVNLSDTTGLANATLFVYNQTNNLVNETTKQLSGTQTTLGIIYEFLYDGIFRWFYKAFDITGNSAFSQNNTITIDTVNPFINYSDGVEEDFANLSQSNVYVNVFVNETNEANITFVLHSTTGLVYRDYYNEDERETNWTGLPDGTYYYNVTVVDLASNENTTQTRTITLDNNAPVISIIYPQNTSYKINVSSINYSFYDITLGYCWYSNNSGIWNSTILRGGINFTNVISVEGSNTWTVYCNDTLGFSAQANVTFFKDTVYPLIDFGDGTEDDFANKSQNWIYVNVTVNETNFANITFTLHNTTSAVNITTYLTEDYDINFTNLVDGVYYYNVTICDILNSCNTTLTRKITLDSSGPDVILNTPVNNTLTNQTTQNLTVNLSDTIGLSNASLFVYNQTNNLVNETTKQLSGTQITLGIIYEFLYDGVFRWLYKAFDITGNAAFSDNNTITIDTTVPLVSIIFPQNESYSATSVNFNFSSNENSTCVYTLNNGATNYSMTSNSSGTGFNATNISIAEGSYRVRAYCSDTLGNKNYTTYEDFSIDISGPVITINSPLADYEYNYSNISFNFSFSDSSEISSAWYYFNETNYSYSEPILMNLEDGNYTLYVYANDSLNNLNFTSRNFSVFVPPNITVFDSENQMLNTSVSVVSRDGFIYNLRLDIEDSLNSPIYIYGFNKSGSSNLTYSNHTNEAWGSSGFAISLEGMIFNYANISVLIAEDHFSKCLNWNMTSLLCNDSDSWEVISVNTIGEYINLTLNSTDPGFIQLSTANVDVLADGTALESNPGTEWGARTYMAISNSTDANAHSMIRFNLTRIPSGVIIDSANLTFRCSGETLDSGDALGVGAHLVYSNYTWAEGTGGSSGNACAAGEFCWNNKPSSSQYNSTNDSSLSIPNGCAGNNYTFSVTNALKYAYEQNYNNVSFYLVPTGINSGNVEGDEIRFNTKDAGTSSYRPRLNITYHTLPKIIILSPLGSFINPGSNATIRANVSDNPLVANISYVYANITLPDGNTEAISLINVSYQIYEANFTNTSLLGRYNLTIIANNTDGYVNSSEKSYFVADNESAAILLNTPENNTYTNQTSWNLTANISDNYLLKNATLFVYNSTYDLINQTAKDLSGTQITLGIIYEFLYDGIFRWLYGVFDAAGNYAESENNTFTLDRIFPLIDYGDGTENPGVFKNQVWIYVNVSVIEDNFDNITFTLHNATGAVNITTSFTEDYDINFTNLIDGTYYYNVTVYDRVNNINFTPTRNITLDTVYPLINYGDGTEDSYANKSRNWIYINVTVNETNFANITFTLYNSTGVVNITTYITEELDINFTNLIDGTYYYNVTVADRARNYNSTLTRVITLDTQGPGVVLNIPKNKTYTSNTTQNLTVNLSDTTGLANATLFVYNQTNNLVNETTKQLSGTQTTLGIIYEFLYDGVFRWFYKAFDITGNVAFSQNNTITIDTVNPFINYSEGVEEDFANLSQSNVYVNVEVIELNEANITFWLFNTTGLVYRDFYNEDERETNWTDLPDGTYYYNVTSVDRASNSNTTPTRTITLDNNAPVVSIIYPQNTSYKINVSSINYSFYDITLGYCWYSNNSGIWNSTILRGGINFTNVISVEGSNTWTVYCNDTLGFSSKANVTFFKDTIYPLIDYGYGTEDDYANKSRSWIYINVSVTEDNFANITFALHNSTGVKNITTYFTQDYDINFTNIIDGTYYYNVTITDAAGNFNSTFTRTIILDTAGPNVILNTPENNTYTKNTTQNLTVNLSDTTGLANATLYVYNSTNNLVNETTKQLSGTQITLGIIYEFLYDGVFRWLYNAFDITGNAAFSDNNTITIDTVNPFVAFGDGTLINGSSVDFDWIYVNVTANETNLANITFYLFNETDGGTLVNASVFTDFVYTINWTGLNKELITYYYSVNITDKAGNINSTETRTILLGNSVPQISIIYPQNTSYNMNVSNLNYSYSDLTLGYCWYSNNSGIWNSSSAVSGDNFTNVISVEGSNTWTVYCNDSFGALNSTSVTFFKDTTYPLIDYGEGTENNYANKSRDWIYVNVTVNETNFANITFTLHNTTGVVNLTTYFTQDYDINFTNLIDGDYYYNVTVCDILNNCNFTTTRKIRLDTQGPGITLNIPKNNTFTKNTTQNLTVNLSDTTGLANATLFVYNQTNNLVNETTKQLSGTQITLGIIYEFLYDGIFRWFYKAFDITGNSAFSQNNTITIDTVNPFINYSDGVEEDFANLSQSNVYVNVTVNETNEANITFVLHNTTGLVYRDYYNEDERETNWTDLPDGTYYYNVTVVDLASNENTTQTRTITLDTTYPLIDYGYGTEDDYANKSRSWIYINVSVTEDNFANITFTLHNSTGVKNITTYFTQDYAINFTNLVDGTYYYNVTVADIIGKVNTTATRRITLDTDNPTATLNTPENNTLKTNSTQNLTVNLTDNIQLSNATLFVYNSTNNLVNQTTKTLSGTQITLGIIYEFLYDGVFKWFYRVLDITGHTVFSENNTITIDTLGPQVNLIFPGNNTAVSNATVSFASNFSEINGLSNATLYIWNSTGSAINVTVRSISGFSNFTNISVQLPYYNTYSWNYLVCDNSSNCAWNNTNFTLYYEREQVGLTLLYPFGDVSVAQNRFFNVTVNVSCLAGYCGEINVSLDPEGWWDSNWKYRKSINVSGTGTSLNDFQVLISTNLTPLYSQGKLNLTCKDIRFTNASGSLISYWIEDCNLSGLNSRIWVKVPSLQASGNTTIFMYYDNNGAESLSNGTATFDFYDDFSGDLSKWTVEKASGVYPRIEDGTLVCGGGTTSGTYGHTVLGSKATYSTFGNGTIEGRIKLAYASATVAGIGEVGFRGNNVTNVGYKSRMDARTAEGISHLEPPYSGWNFLNGGACTAVGGGVPHDQWIDLKITVTGYIFNITLTSLGTSRQCTDSTSPYQNTGEISLQNHYGNNATFDNIRVRKYSATDPVYSFGGEELGMKSGLVSTVIGATPFYTNESNPRNITLTKGQSQEIVFFVNATGTGTHVFYAYANLTSNLSIGNRTNLWNVTIDTSAPLINITSPLNQTYNSSIIYFNVTSNENLSSCKFTLNEWLTNYTMTQVNSTYFIFTNDSIGDKGYTAKFYCSDLASNVNNTERVSFVVDALGPNATLNTPLNNTYTNQTSQNLTVNLTDAIGLKNATLFVYNSTGSLVNETTKTLSGTQITLGIIYQFLYEGVFSWFYKAFDLAGHSILTENNTITIDTINPLISYGDGTENTYTNFSRNWIYVNVTFNDTNFANVTFRLYNDTGQVNTTAYFTPVYQINWTGLPDSLYRYNVTITDKANNRNYTETRFLRLDNVYPSLFIFYPTNRTYSYNVSDMNYSAYDITLDSCWWSNDSGETNQSITCGQNITEQNASDGAHLWGIYANDSAGHLSSLSIAFSVNTELPKVIIYYPANITYPFNVTEINFSAKDTDLDSCWYSLNGAPNITADCSQNITGITSVEGANTLFIYANDSGEGLGFDYQAFTVDTTPPRISIESPLNTTYYPEALTFNISANEDLSYCKFTLDNWVTNYTMTQRNTTYFNYTNISMQEGAYIARFWCNDSMNNVNATEAISFAISYPTIQAILFYPTSEINVTRSGYFNFTVNVSCSVVDCGDINVTLDPANWWNDSWRYRKEINITNTAATTLVDFPAYLNITYNESMKTDFSDLRFINGSCNVQGGGLMDYEIENYTPKNANVWVRIPSLVSGKNTLCVYYNNSAASSAQNKTGVWKSNYKMVLHLSEGSTGTRYDSSLNGNNGTPSGYDNDEKIAGLVGSADNLATNDYISTNYLQDSVTQYTIAALIRTSTTTGTIVQDRGSGAGYSLTLAIRPPCGGAGCSGASDGVPGFGVDRDAVWIGSYGATRVDDGNWHYVVGVFNSTSGETVTYPNLTVYIDGQLSSGGGVNQAGTPVAPLTGLSGTAIGYHQAWSGNYFNGAIDELTISNVVRTPQWINQTYQLMFNQNNFVSFGEDEEYSLLKGIVNTTYGALPFFTDENPITISLNKSQSQEVVFFVNVTGAGTYEFFAFANLTREENVSVTSARVNITIVLPNITLLYPIEENFSSFDIPQFNFSINDGSFGECELWGNWSGASLQTISLIQVNATLNFSSQNVGDDGYHTWYVRCNDTFGNLVTSGSARFAAFLFPDAVNLSYFNAIQNKNDGTGNLTIFWNSSNHSIAYKIYYNESLSGEFIYLNTTISLNYTDTTFAGNKRRFYRIDSWNPTGQNSTTWYFGAHVYELGHNGNTRNWIGFPTNFSYLSNANNTLREIRNATAFAYWNETIQKRVSCTPYLCPQSFECTDEACNFELERGRGYEAYINSSAPSAINWSGVGVVYENKTISLNKNSTSFAKNWIAMWANTSLIDAQDLIQSITNADAVSRWNPSTQKSEGLVPSEFPWAPYIGKNFNINLEEGYEASVTSSGTWNQE